MTLADSLGRLQAYIEKNNYRGFDPYDALKSPFFRLPLLRSFKLARFGMQQVVKRSPVNLRPLLLVPKGYNPVTLGLSIQAYSYMYQSGFREKEDCLKNIDFLISELKDLVPAGFSGACWGYDFDWEARYARIPAYQPTVVATGVITHGLYECYRLTGNEEALSLCKSASAFVLKDLKRHEENNTLCFSYSPFDQQQVYNASMKGARLLAQVYSITGEKHLLDTAKAAVQYVVNRQNEDGSWYYSEKGTGKWIDNYHTGYILDCLDEYIRCTGDKSHSESLQKGVTFYKSHFFTEEHIPKFYHNKTWPVDCTSAGQSILSLCRFGDIGKAKKVAKWMKNNMQSHRGFFYFRKTLSHTIKTPFMRWSQAWMFCGMAYLIHKKEE